MANFLTTTINKTREAIRKGFLSVVDSRGSWWGVIRETYPGAWQNNATALSDSTLSYFAVFSCITLIASDNAKLPFQLARQKRQNVWEEISDPKIDKILNHPNRYQNHMQFKESWAISKMIHGNAFILKSRDASGMIVGLYVLDPSRVQTLVAPDGSIFYSLNTDNISGLQTATVTVPASDIIHDRYNTFFHPLVGLSPLYAAALGASQGLQIQEDQDKFFGQGAKPSGILTAPGAISDETAARLKEYWQTNFTGDNAGKIAVVGDGLKFEQLRMTAVDAQMIETLKWTAIHVCSAFHVPPWKIGIEKAPNASNPESLSTIYYTDCLQQYVQSIELGMTQGLDLAPDISVRMDLDYLFRMDTSLTIKTLADGIKGGIYKPNEARAKLNLPPVTGGNSVYLQQQNFSLEALAKRDSQNPLGVAVSAGNISESDANRAGANDEEHPDDDEEETEGAETPEKMFDLLESKLGKESIRRFEDHIESLLKKAA